MGCRKSSYFIHVWLVPDESQVGTLNLSFSTGQAGFGRIDSPASSREGVWQVFQRRILKHIIWECSPSCMACVAGCCMYGACSEHPPRLSARKLCGVS